MKTIVVLALDGMMDSSLAITLDTVRTGQAFLARAGKGPSVKLVVAGDRARVTAAAGMQLRTDVTLRDLARGTVRPDWIVIPGLGLTTPETIDMRLDAKDARRSMDLLRSLRCTIAAACSSVFLLAEAGLLSGRNATMTWWLAQYFRARYPDVALDESKMLVRDGRFLTAGSAYSHLDLMLAIVAETMGANVAHLCSRYLLIDQRPSQARYMVHTHAQHLDPTVIAAERWIDANLSRAIRVTDVAAAVAVSPRTLSRRIEAATGTSPVKFVQRRRLLLASHLIETTKMSIDDVSERVGYQDAAALRKLVKREFGRSPAALRR